MCHEAWHGRCFPGRFGGDLDIVTLGTVVVDNDFFFLPVALTRSEDNGSCILEHGDEVGDYDGLCVQVFRSGKELGTLPSPSRFLLVVVVTMTGPQGEVSALQSMRNIQRG